MPAFTNLLEQVIDWSDGTPKPLITAPCNTRICRRNAPPNRSLFFFADVSSVTFKYEVRVTRSSNRRLVINVYGLSSKQPFTPQVGGTVLQHDLVESSAASYTA
ncbi:hypothetical protein [Paenibacillus sedimenti]|uniref:Uncharacterized protein n=1 Tax=Paenibacillus sedimenti TaxID=2770274 RepID=A0A926KR53_9BACL|nr:hypothetical protein [Paenibacillus sedimenti]MBD0382562.1 hypothetical protein [Paenibacillus sedimenti]